MRVGFVICLLSAILTVGIAVLAAGADLGTVAVVANGALIYGLTAALR